DGVDMVQGRTEPVGPVGLLERSLWVTREDGLYATCNVLYRRSAFEEAGGFQDAGTLLGFRPGAFGRGLGMGEDALLGWKRAREARRLERSPAPLMKGVAVEMATDVVTGTALAAASVRAREPVL